MAVAYTTDDELIEIYAFRADLFQRIEQDPSFNSVCGVGAVAEGPTNAFGMPIDTDDFDAKVNLILIERTLGRAWGRSHIGRAPWMSTVDLGTDEDAWDSFVEYLFAEELDHVFDALADIGEGVLISNERSCRAQADLYSIASERPNDWIVKGRVRLLDFMRAYEMLNLG